MLKTERRIAKMINEKVESGEYSAKDKEFISYMWKSIKNELVEFNPSIYIMRLGYFHISKKKLFNSIYKKISILREMKKQGIPYDESHKDVILLNKYLKSRHEVTRFYNQKRSRFHSGKLENVSLQDK